MRVTVVAAMAMLGGSAAMAQEMMVGDAAAGEEHFRRQCISCHVVQNEDGEVLAGRNAKVGPNLHGVIGRVAGSDPDFNYSDLMMAYAENEAVWEEASFVAYVQDPTGFLREARGKTSGRSKMAYQVRDEQEAHDLYAYLATFSPDEETVEDGEAASAEGEAASE